VAAQTLLGERDTSLIVLFPGLVGGNRSASQIPVSRYRSASQVLVGGYRSASQVLVGGYRSTAQVLVG
jgi:hypothetical protein